MVVHYYNFYIPFIFGLYETKKWRKKVNLKQWSHINMPFSTVSSDRERVGYILSPLGLNTAAQGKKPGEE
jgi:hypothetical protein